jgi:hypothetical protein
LQPFAERVITGGALHGAGYAGSAVRGNGADIARACRALWRNISCRKIDAVRPCAGHSGL